MTCDFAGGAVCDEMSEKAVSYRWTADETVHKVMTQDSAAVIFCEKHVFCRGNRGKSSQGHEKKEFAFDVEKKRCYRNTII